MKKIAIAGGGISGLSLAYLLKQKNPDIDVTVFESDSRPGGKVYSEKTKDGYLCEKGPNGFLDNKPHTLELCKMLAIEPVRSNEKSKKRFILNNGILAPLPESPGSFIKSALLSPGGKLRLLLELTAVKGPQDETVADFIIRRLGQQALDKLIDPMCSGIYAGDPYNMSILSCFPRIKELEQQYGSLIKALYKLKKERKKSSGGEVSATPSGTLTSFFNGAQTITDALAASLKNSVKLSSGIKEISRQNNMYQLHTEVDTYDADVVVIATPGYAASQIIKNLDQSISELLGKITYPHLAVVCFGYSKEKVEHNLDGFGFLVPSVEGRKILGTLWDSSVFPNRASEGKALLRSMIGGAKFPEMADLDDDKIASTVLDELRSIMGLKNEPDMIKVYRWQKAIPQYRLGHAALIDAVDAALTKYPGLHLTGNSYRG
ncbi:MAG: protoporphyrinogen oxidase, partial [Nitrospira sp.]|nr:protoporphyrinogen oxidase [Nitrospira sp.]